MTRAEMLATFFVHDENGWRLKGHAHEAFYRWLVSWGIFCRRPSDLGFSDDGYILPGLTISEDIVSAEGITGEYLLPEMNLGGIGGRSAVRRQTLKTRVDALVTRVERTPGPWIVWCGLNDEQDAIAAALDGDCVSIQGRDDEDQKTERLSAFLEG